MTQTETKREWARPTEEVAKAIYSKPTQFDGDSVGTHLGQSYNIDGSAHSPSELRSLVMTVCNDAAEAAINKLRELGFVNIQCLDALKAEAQANTIPQEGKGK